MSAPDPLEYQSAADRQLERGRSLLATLAHVLGLINACWAVLLIAVQWAPMAEVHKPLSWLLIGGLVPSTTAGIVFAIVAGNRPDRRPALCANIVVAVVVVCVAARSF